MSKKVMITTERIARDLSLNNVAAGINLTMQNLRSPNKWRRIVGILFLLKFFEVVATLVAIGGIAYWLVFGSILPPAFGIMTRILMVFIRIYFVRKKRTMERGV